MKKIIIAATLMFIGFSAVAQTATDTTLQNNLYEAGTGLKSSATFYRLGIAVGIAAAMVQVRQTSAINYSPVVPVFLGIGSLVCFYIATVNLKYAGKSLIKASGKKK